MSADARWIRMNVDWHESPWLAALPWHVRSVWTVILCHMKVNGRGGRCRAPILKRFAAMYDIPEECVTALRNAAIEEGALAEEDGEWIVSNWEVYQQEDRTNAERQKRHRDKKKGEDNAVTQVQSAVSNSPVTGDNTTVTALRNATETETYTGTETKTGERIDPSDQEDTRGVEPILAASDGPEYWRKANEPMRSVGLCLCLVGKNAGSGWPTEEEVRRHVGAKQACRQLVDKIGWQKAAELYSWCAQHMDGGRGWPSIWSNHPGWIKQMEAGGVERIPRIPSPPGGIIVKKETMAETLARLGGANAA